MERDGWLYDLDQAEVEHERSSAELREGILSLRAKLGQPDPGFLAMMGELIMGAREKQAQNNDGTVTTSSWTMDEIVQAGIQYTIDVEPEARQGMAEEIIDAMQSQWHFFRGQKSLMPQASSSRIVFMAAVLQRFLKAQGILMDPRPVPVSENYPDVELLEAVRRTVLRPSYTISEGFNESGLGIPSYNLWYEERFWKQLKEDHNQLREAGHETSDLDDYRRAQKEMVGDKVEGYGSEDWEEIVQLEGMYFTDYLNILTESSRRRILRRLEFLKRASKSGVRVYTDDEIRKFEEESDLALRLGEELRWIQDFDQVLPWVKQKLGEDAGFPELLQILQPMDLGEDPDTFRKRHFIV